MTTFKQTPTPAVPTGLATPLRPPKWWQRYVARLLIVNLITIAVVLSVVVINLSYDLSSQNTRDMEKSVVSALKTNSNTLNASQSEILADLEDRIKRLGEKFPSSAWSFSSGDTPVLMNNGAKVSDSQFLDELANVYPGTVATVIECDGRNCIRRKTSLKKDGKSLDGSTVSDENVLNALEKGEDYKGLSEIIKGTLFYTEYHKVKELGSKKIYLFAAVSIQAKMNALAKALGSQTIARTGYYIAMLSQGTERWKMVIHPKEDLRNQKLLTSSSKDSETRVKVYAELETKQKETMNGEELNPLKITYSRVDDKTGQTDEMSAWYQDSRIGLMLMARVPTAEILEGAVHTRNKIILEGLLGLIVIGTLNFLWTRRQSRPIETVSKALQEIAGGDLTVRHPETERRDEVGGLIRSTNQLGVSLQSLVNDIQHSADEVEKSSTSLLTQSSGLAESCRTQSDTTASIAASTEELSVTSDHIAENIKSAGEIARKARDVATDGRTVVCETDTEVRGIISSVKQAMEELVELIGASKEIQAITGTIDEIASRINLLALNAAIEAARAGESGRGFSVVADEIRKLAESTTKAVGEIKKKAERIQDPVTSIEASLCATEQHIVHVDKSLAGVVQSYDMIVDETQRTDANLSDAASSAMQGAQATQGVAQSIEEIAVLTERNTDASKAIAEASRTLATLGRTLNETTMKFKTV